MYRRLGFLSALLVCVGIEAAPLPTNDQNPYLAGFGLPRGIGARLPSSSAWQLDLNWASTALVQDARDEFMIVDAETRELRLTYRRRVSERWAFELQLPHRHTSGGSLDSFIDDWHELFGLPEGSRPIQPRDRLRLHYSRSGETLIEHDATTSGLGDLVLGAQYALHDSDGSAASIALHVKAPTGKHHWLNSSGATDISIVAAGERRLGERWSIEGQLAATRLGEGRLLPRLQRDLVWSARAGITVQLVPAFDLALQLDGHTRAFDSDLPILSAPLVTTIGFRWRFAPGWTVTGAVSEDIDVERSPDVVFVLGVKRGL
jgi:hypothetical protein